MTERWRGCLLEVAETLVLTLVIFLTVQFFVVQPYQVQQQSMEATLEPGQYVLVDKLTPHFDDYKRGDIVVFPPPNGYAESDQPGVPFIKRVIGVAGDTVEIRDGTVYVNGRALDERYVYQGQPTTATGTSRWYIEPGQLFVLGDHRERSLDSRVFGPINKNTVIGRAWLRYWPANSFGFLPSFGTSEASPSPAP